MSNELKEPPYTMNITKWVVVGVLLCLLWLVGLSVLGPYSGLHLRGLSGRKGFRASAGKAGQKGTTAVLCGLQYCAFGLFQVF